MDSKENAQKEILRLRQKYSAALAVGWDKDENLRNMRTKIKTLIEKSNVMSLIAKIVRSDNVFHPLPENQLKQKVRYPQKGQPVINKNAFGKLVSELEWLRDFYGFEISVKNPKKEDFDINFICSMPKYSQLRIKGRELKVRKTKLTGYEFVKKVASSKCLLNEIKIDDITKREDFEKGNRSQLFDVFGLLINETIPTVLKYNRFSIQKFLLIHIPEGISVTPFIDLYRSRLGDMHKEVYEKTFVGARPTRQEIERKILEVLKEYPTGGGLIKALKDGEYGNGKPTIQNVSLLLHDRIQVISSDSLKSHYSHLSGDYLKKLLKK